MIKRGIERRSVKITKDAVVTKIVLFYILKKYILKYLIQYTSMNH